MAKFIFYTTGTESNIRFEELGVYFEHPVSAYTLSDYFDLDEITSSVTIQEYIDDGHILAFDEYGVAITNVQNLNVNIPIFDIDNSFYNLSYIGYGSENNCKIQKIITVYSGYTGYWSSGNENYDKIWSARTEYAYF